MSKKVCPLMSGPVPALGHYNEPIVEVQWVECQEQNCQLWATIKSFYTTNKLQIQGCSLELAVHRTKDGLYAV